MYGLPNSTMNCPSFTRTLLNTIGSDENFDMRKLNKPNFFEITNMILTEIS